MAHIQMAVRFVLSCMAVFAATQAGVANSGQAPYDRIPQRNPFGLRTPEPVQPPRAEPVPLPAIKLQGLSTIAGQKRALLKIQFPATPQAPAREESCILTESQRYDGIELLQIDIKVGSIRVNNSGTPMMITFDSRAPEPPGPPLPPMPL